MTPFLWRKALADPRRYPAAGSGVLRSGHDAARPAQNPISVYGTILEGAFGTSRTYLGHRCGTMAMLLGISLAVTPAFKMRFWNIGAEGQILIGCLATAACMIMLGGQAAQRRC